MKNIRNKGVTRELAFRIVEDILLEEIDEACDEIEKKGYEFVLKPLSKDEVHERFFAETRHRLGSDSNRGLAERTRAFFNALAERFQVTGIRTEFAQTDDEGLIEITVRYGNGQVPLWVVEDEEDHAIEFYSADRSLVGKRLVIASKRSNWKTFCEFIPDTSSRDFTARSLLSPRSLALPVTEAVKEFEIFISDSDDPAQENGK